MADASALILISLPQSQAHVSRLRSHKRTWCILRIASGFEVQSGAHRVHNGCRMRYWPVKYFGKLAKYAPLPSPFEPDWMSCVRPHVITYALFVKRCVKPNGKIYIFFCIYFGAARCCCWWWCCDTTILDIFWEDAAGYTGHALPHKNYYFVIVYLLSALEE